MTIKITEKQAKLIDRLVDDKWFISRIAEKIGLPHEDVRVYVRGYENQYDYQNQRVQQKGFASYNDYVKHLERKRQKNPLNKRLSKLIKKRLKELGKNQSWLAGEIGVSKITISKYKLGKIIPERDNITNLFSALEVPYKTLDEMMRDDLYFA